MSLLQSLISLGAAVVKDFYYNYVTLLLHGDGTNGGQNNTFLDSSTNAFSITRNGNVSQGSFSPFSKPDGSWSYYFDGTDSCYLSMNQILNSTVDVTVECWIYPTAASPANAGYIAAQYVLGGSDRTIFAYSSQQVSMQIGSTYVTGTSSTPIEIGRAHV